MLKKSLKDKRVLITGAVSGIGSAIAVKFAQEGAQLILWGIKKLAYRMGIQI